ncbi:hypothetical protein M1397_03670 [Candidatus Marsarchaeota archaeon]|nr:hypothetical protein [Candidatus Marsarchaeota archaeon]
MWEKTVQKLRKGEISNKKTEALYREFITGPATSQPKSKGTLGAFLRHIIK